MWAPSSWGGPPSRKSVSPWVLHQEVGGEVDPLPVQRVVQEHERLVPQDGRPDVLYQSLSEVPHCLQVFREPGQRPLGIVTADALQLAVPDEGPVLHGVAVDHLGFHPGALPDGDVIPGIFVDQVEAPHVTEHDDPELRLEFTAFSLGHPVLDLGIAAAVQPHHLVVLPGGLDVLPDLLQPGAVLAFSVEGEVVIPQRLRDLGGGYVGDLRPPAEVQPIS